MGLYDMLMQMGNVYGQPYYGQEGPPQTMPNGLLAYPGAPLGMAQLPPQPVPPLAGTNPFSAPMALGMEMGEQSTMGPQNYASPVPQPGLPTLSNQPGMMPPVGDMMAHMPGIQPPPMLPQPQQPHDLSDDYMNPYGVMTGGQHIQSKPPQQPGLFNAPMPDPQIGMQQTTFPPDGNVDHSREGNFNRAFGDDTVRMEEAIRRDQKQNILQSLYAAAGANPGDIAGMLGAAAPGMAGAMPDFPVEEMRRQRQQERLETLAKIKALNAPVGGYRSPRQATEDRAYMEDPEGALAATKRSMFGQSDSFGLPVGEVDFTTGPDGEKLYDWAGEKLTREEMMEVVRAEKLKAYGDKEIAERRVEAAGDERKIQTIMRIMKTDRAGAERAIAWNMFPNITGEADDADVMAAYTLFGEQGAGEVMERGTDEERARYQEAQARNDKDIMALIVLEVKKRTGG